MVLQYNISYALFGLLNPDEQECGGDHIDLSAVRQRSLESTDKTPDTDLKEVATATHFTFNLSTLASLPRTTQPDRGDRFKQLKSPDISLQLISSLTHMCDGSVHLSGVGV